LNNSDRMPIHLLWNNSGNPNNLILQIHRDLESKSVIAIDAFVVDQIVTSTMNPMGYVQKVKSLVSLVLEQDQQISNSIFTALKKIIENNTGFDIQDNGLNHIKKGFVDCLKILTGKSPSCSSISSFENLMDECIQQVSIILDPTPGDPDSAILMTSMLLEKELDFIKAVFKGIKIQIT